MGGDGDGERKLTQPESGDAFEIPQFNQSSLPFGPPEAVESSVAPLEPHLSSLTPKRPDPFNEAVEAGVQVGEDASDVEVREAVREARERRWHLAERRTSR